MQPASVNARTARPYRRVQTIRIFLSVMGGSALVASATNDLPIWLTVLGSTLLTIAGVALVAIRPADKATSNEADARRYQAFMTRADKLDAEALAQAALDVPVDLLTDTRFEKTPSAGLSG